MNMEIVLENVQKEFLEEIIHVHFRFDISDIISSHFYNCAGEEVLQYQEISDWNAYFLNKGTSDLFLSKVNIGMELKNAVILINCDSPHADITINFEESQFCSMSTDEAKREFKMLLQKLIGLSETYKIDHIVIGYEPAVDHDMKMIELICGHLVTLNEDIPERVDKVV